MRELILKPKPTKYFKKRKLKHLQWWPTKRTATSHLNPWTYTRSPRVT